MYGSVVALAMENEVANRAEWRAVLRISCLLEALRLPDEELEVAIDACKAKRHSTKEVELKYHGKAPAQRPCTEAHVEVDVQGSLGAEGCGKGHFAWEFDENKN